MKIERDHFVVQPPFEWSEIPSDDPFAFEFRNQKFPEQLIISVLLSPELLGPARVKSLAEELTRKRMRAIDAITDGQAVSSSPQFQSGRDQWEARCFACDETHKVRFGFVVAVAPAKVVTVALTRYFLEEPGYPFEVYAGYIFDLVQVKNPGTPAGT